MAYTVQGWRVLDTEFFLDGVHWVAKAAGPARGGMIDKCAVWQFALEGIGGAREPRGLMRGKPQRARRGGGYEGPEQAGAAGAGRHGRTAESGTQKRGAR